ncbi:MAG: cupin domain-containing protein [Gammaproteobacteria bacterium]|nr:cupin domain-containing protein [Gammaproteobacteria bacterium]
MDRAQLPCQATEVAPDGSEVRKLVRGSRASLVHCTLPAGATSKAVTHATIEEVWYFTNGCGQVWRKRGAQERVVEVSPGTALTIAPGTAFQFRNTGTDELRFIIASMPPWPGDEEAVEAPGHWR